jgi:hypothetical protein
MLVIAAEAAMVSRRSKQHAEFQNGMDSTIPAEIACWAEACSAERGGNQTTLAIYNPGSS